MNRTFVASVLLAGLILVPSNLRAQNTIYVDTRAIGANNGTSWDNAFTDLQNALQVAQHFDEIWIAEGIYKPVTPASAPNVTDSERDVSFQLRNGVSIIGGFAGNETSLDQRNYAAHPTILSGDLLNNDTAGLNPIDLSRRDNSWHVLVLGDALLGAVNEMTVVDGVTITGGNANPPPLVASDAGGGLYVVGSETDFSSPVIRNTRIEANSGVFGGGVGCLLSGPTFVNVDIVNNFALKDGGGMNATLCEANLKDVRFTGNTAGEKGGGIMNNRRQNKLVGVSFLGNTAPRGGGAYNQLDQSLFINTLFASNEAAVSGGGMYNFESNADMMNLVFTGNRTSDPPATQALRGGAGMYNFRESPYMTNIVFFGNETPGDGGAMLNVNSNPIVANSILWGNQADRDGKEIFNGGNPTGLPIFANNIVEGGLPPNVGDADGNLDVNPMFAGPGGPDQIVGTLDDDFRLLTGSPAIDSGVNPALLFDTLDLDEDGVTEEEVPIDFLGNFRIYNGNGGDFVVDMGAYEFGSPPVKVSIESDVAEIPVAPVFVEAFPNPFRDQTTLRFALPTSDRVVLKVFDMLGRKVVTMIDDVLPAGTHDARFYAPDLSSGLYLFQLDIAGTRTTKKMTLVK